MTRTTAAKLTVFIILAFIVCLPEFFPSHKEIHIEFFCLPFDPCDATKGHGPNDDGKDCEETLLVPENGGGAKPQCKEEPKNMTNQDEPVNEWFVCDTQIDLQSLDDNTSLSGVDVNVVLSLQTMNMSLQNITAHGHVNGSGLHTGSFRNVSLVRCCGQTSLSSAEPKTVQSPGRMSYPAPDSASNQMRTLSRSQCFLHYQATAVPGTPAKKGRWWCLSTTVWLVLVLIVVIVVLVSVGVQVCTIRRCCHKKAVRVPSTVRNPKTFSQRRTKSLGDLPDAFHTEDEVPFVEKARADHWRGLSPINETSVDGDEVEDIFDGPAAVEGIKDSFNTGPTPAHIHSASLTHLHHRGHVFA